MSHSNFLHQIMDWAKKCIELIRFQKAWEKGRVPDEELADHAVLSGAETDSNQENSGKSSPGRLLRALGLGGKSGQPAEKPGESGIQIEVYGAGSPVAKAAVSSPASDGDKTVEPDEAEILEALEKASEKSFALLVDKSEETVFPGQPTLLVIDDYQPLREMIARAFRGNQYNVCTAKDGVEGIVRIHENDIDLIITDVQMPRLDGFEMSKMLNVREKTREIPVIFLTEVLDDQTRAISKRLGAADTLIKPFTMDALFESVKTIVQTHSKKDLTWHPSQESSEPLDETPSKETVALSQSE